MKRNSTWKTSDAPISHCQQPRYKQCGWEVSYPHTFTNCWQLWNIIIWIKHNYSNILFSYADIWNWMRISANNMNIGLWIILHPMLTWHYRDFTCDGWLANKYNKLCLILALLLTDRCLTYTQNATSWLHDSFFPMYKVMHEHIIRNCVLPVFF